ncbi:hypothetical protein AKO1_002178 [Acrasis kona]|uniref:SANT domain-containing protein n=1 Tax=Acrasis kona TaxID=1008807 RepID=A0AAW2Z8Z3_9EUKA
MEDPYANFDKIEIQAKPKKAPKKRKAPQASKSKKRARQDENYQEEEENDGDANNDPPRRAARTIRDIIRDTKSGKPTKKVARLEKKKLKETLRKQGMAVSDSEEEEEEPAPTDKQNNDNTGLQDVNLEEFDDHNDFEPVNTDNPFDEDMDKTYQVEVDQNDEFLEDELDSTTNNDGGFKPRLRLDEHGNMVIDEDFAIITDERRTDYNEFERVTEGSGSTTYINQRTYSRRKGGNGRWSDDDTELFYKCLRQFGAEFSMISRMFVGKDRTDIKNKFKKEERENPQEIENALYNKNKRLAIDVEMFKRVSKQKDDVEGIVRNRVPRDESDEPQSKQDQNDDWDREILDGGGKVEKVEEYERVDLGEFNEDEFNQNSIFNKQSAPLDESEYNAEDVDPILLEEQFNEEYGDYY